MKTREELFSKVKECVRWMHPEFRNKYLGLMDGVWQNGYHHGYSDGYSNGVKYVTDSEMKKLEKAHLFKRVAKE